MPDRVIDTIADGVVFPEGPRWREDGLYFSDMYGKHVYRIAADGALHVLATVDAQPSGLGWLRDGTMLIVSMQDTRLLTLRDNEIEIAVDLSDLTDAACNDMVVDAVTGRAYIGSMPRLSTDGFPTDGNPDLNVTRGLPPSPIILVEFDGTGSVAAKRIVADGLQLPNGLTLTSDRSELIVAESGGHRLLAFPVSADGSLGEPDVWAELGLMPDGIALDAEGCVWVAAPLVASGPSRYLRIARGGAVLDRIDVPTHAAMAVALGGPDGHTLYMVESKQVLHATSTDNGRVRATRVDVPAASARGEKDLGST